MPRTKKADGGGATGDNGEVDVTATASPDTQVTVEATGTQPAGGDAPAGGGATAALLQAVRENPIPAGMIWAGLGWLVASAVGAKRPQVGAAQAVTGVATKTQQTIGQLTTGAQQRAGRTTETVTGAVGQLRAAGQQRAQSATGRAKDAVTGARATLTDVASTARERATTQGQRARTGVRQMVSEKPVVVEVAAVAAGTAVGLAIPATPREQRLLAPRREQILDRLDTVGEQAVDKVQQMLEQSQQSQG